MKKKIMIVAFSALLVVGSVGGVAFAKDIIMKDNSPGFENEVVNMDIEIMDEMHNSMMEGEMGRVMDEMHNSMMGGHSRMMMRR